VGNFTTLGSNLAMPAYAASTAIFLWVNGIITFTAAGTFSMSAGIGSGAVAWTVLAGSFLDVIPVS
jgi:hypothetical protein